VPTTDHKKIGIMYLVLTFVFFMLGVEALMRSQLSVPNNTLLTSEHSATAAHAARHDDDLPVQSQAGEELLPADDRRPTMVFPGSTPSFCPCWAESSSMRRFFHPPSAGLREHRRSSRCISARARTRFPIQYPNRQSPRWFARSIPT